MNLSKKSKIFLSVIVLLLVAVFAVYKYSMQPPAKIESKKVDFSGTSEALLNQVQKDATIWENKVVELTGVITSKDEKGITLSNQIYCQFREDVQAASLQNEQKITLKGRIIGYDDLLEELKLDQCIIQQ
jgi:uncharacterized protein YdeI (BOF family)